MIPFQITFLNTEESDAVWISIQNRIEKLEKIFHRIVRCEVAVSCPHRHRRSGRIFQIKIRIVIPRNDVFIDHDPSGKEEHQDIYIAIRDSFDSAERVLRGRVARIRGLVKRHER